MKIWKSDSPLFLRCELDTIRWLRLWLVGDCYLFSRLPQQHPLTFRELTSCQIDIGLAVVQCQVSRQGYHPKALDSTLQLFGLAPNPLLLFDDASHKLSTLWSNRCPGAALERYNILSRDGSINLLDRECSGNARVAPNFRLIDTTDKSFFYRLRGIESICQTVFQFPLFC